jgi:hypothetical protein
MLNRIISNDAERLPHMDRISGYERYCIIEMLRIGFSVVQILGR